MKRKETERKLYGHTFSNSSLDSDIGLSETIVYPSPCEVNLMSM